MPGIRRTSDNITGLTELVEARYKQGLPIHVIAGRLGESYDKVRRIVGQIKEKEMPKVNDQDKAVVDGGVEQSRMARMTVQEHLENLRRVIRGAKLNSLQSHEAQDLKMELIKKVDDLEVELRKRG